MTESENPVPVEPDEAAPGDGPADETAPTTEAAPTTGPAPDELARQLEESQAKAAEYLDGWQRALAEFSNYRKRQEGDRTSSQNYMKGELIKHFLPVLDDLERAMNNRPDDKNSAAWADGIELIQRKLQSILEAEGVQAIQADGQPFDPNFHEAISHEESPDHQSGQVIAVVQQGYMLGERVIRPALVRVAR